MAKLPANARQDSEERFARLKEQLRAHDIGGLLSVQSVPLVERLLGDLLESRERCRTAETNYDHARKEYLSAEQQLQPLKDDNTRLMHENNALHLELIHEAERKDEQNRKLILGLEKLRAEKSDLLFLNAQFQLQVTEAEKRAEGLQDSLAKLTDSMAPAHHRESRISVSQRLAEPVPGEQAQSDTRIAEQQDLLKIKDVKIARLQAAEEELSTLKAALETDLTAVVEKLSRRDEEIERLSKLLDGGQDYQKLSFDHVNRTNQQLVSNLNDQVKFLTSQIVNLENEVLHRQGLHEEAEKQHMDLAVKHKSEQAELHDSRVRVQELESEVAQLRHELALTSAETHDTEVERLAKQKLESGLRAQSMSSIQDGAEGGGSAAAGGGGGSATAEISRLRLAGEEAAKRVSAADAELQAVRREVSGLSTDLDTARRELLRARRERDGAQEEAERLRTAAAEHDALLATLRAEARQTSETLLEADSVTAAHREEVSRLSTELLDKDTELRSLAVERDRLEAELRKLRELEGDVSALQVAASQARDASSSRETENLRLRQEHERMGELLQMKNQEVDSLQDNARATQHELEQAKRQHERLNGEHEAQSTQLAMLEQEQERMTGLLRTSSAEQQRLTAAVREEKSKAADAQQKYDVVVEEGHELSQQMQELRAERDGLSLSARTTQQEMERLHRQQEHSHTSLEQARGEQREMEAAVRELREERDSVSKLYGQLQEQLKVLRSEYESRAAQGGDTEGLLRARISELESNVIQCNEETAEARQRAELSRTTAQQLSTESTALAKTVSELRKSRADAQRSADALAAQVESLERAAAAHQSELDRALGLAKGRQAEIEQMHTLFSHLDATRAELVETLRRERAGAAQTESGLQELRTRHEETVQQLSRKEQEHEQALVTLRKLDAERDSMSNQLDSAAEAQATLARATEQQEAAQQAAERALSDTEAALQAAVLQRDASISELEGLQQALQRAEAGRRSVEEELQLKANENVALSDDLANLTRENQAVNAELMSATGERDQCRQNMAAMEVRVQNAESQIAMKDTERTELLAAYRQLHDSNAQLLEAAQQAEREGEHYRAAHAASQAELVATRGAAADLEANHLVHDDQLATFRQQSQEYTRMAKKLQDELAQAKAAQHAAEEGRAQAISLRTASELTNQELQRKLAEAQQHKELATMEAEQAVQARQATGTTLAEQESKVAELEALLQAVRMQASRPPAVDSHDDEARMRHVRALEASNANLVRQVEELESRVQAQARVQSINSPGEADAVAATHDQPRLAHMQSERDAMRQELSKASAEVQSLRSQMEADRAQRQQDDTYKLQTMQYLRKYEAELQKKEMAIVKLKDELQALRQKS